MKEQENTELLKDYLVHLGWIEMNIKYRQLHNKYIFFENYLKQVWQLKRVFFHILV